MTGSKVKRRVFYGVTGLTAAFLVVMLGPALIFPVLAWLPDSTLLGLFDDIEAVDLAHRLHELTIGIFSWVLVLGVFMQFHRPERKVAPLLQAVAIPLALTVVEVINGNFVVADTAPLLIPILVLAFLHPSGRDLIRLGRFDPLLAGLIALAAFPWLAFASGQARLQQLGIAGDAHSEAGHWGLMAGFAVLILLWGLIGASDRPGWRITAFITALSSVLYGAHSLLFPEGASAAPAGWAMAVLAWGALYGLAAARRREEGDEDPARGKEAAHLRPSGMGDA